jgi:membrane protease subunit (stomatin/prohibitin family)
VLLVDGGRVIDYCAEPGYYTVDNTASPSLFNGELMASVKETFHRIKFGGVPSASQKAFFINLQEIKGIKFGTPQAVNYFDSFYNAELFLRAHGTYSIKIVDPLKFYAEAVPRNATRVQIADINEQYMSEFLEGLQTSINNMSAAGIRISFVTSKATELSQYMATALDADWREKRGMEIMSVGLASISYDPKSRELIDMRNQGAMLGDPNVRAGYVAGSVARGVEAAGSNAAGNMNGFMGVGIGASMASIMGAMGSAQGATSAPQAAAPQPTQTAPAAGWQCACGQTNTGKFCSNCGAAKPAVWYCPQCGKQNDAAMKFCPDCGTRKP